MDTFYDPGNFPWTLLAYAAGVFFLVAFMIALSHFLGQRHNERETGEPFESGVKSTGGAQVRFSVHFYLVAMLFVIFDLEVAFLVAWAIAFKQVGWVGFAAASLFILLLIVVLLYEWRIGALDFAASGKQIVKRMQKMKAGKL